MAALPQTLRRPIASGEAEETFYLVGLTVSARSLEFDRYVRRDASPSEPDPWVRVPGLAGRSSDVHRFRTEAEAKAWAAERKRLKRTHCRVKACRGPVFE